MLLTLLVAVVLNFATMSLQDTVAKEMSVTDVQMTDAPQPESARPAVHALKTNALYDLFAIPSLGYEVSIGKSFSLGIGAHYAWWKSDLRKWFNQTYGGEVLFRWWFGSLAREQRLSGHHLGVYVQAITYDLEFGDSGQQARRPEYAAGLDYGYSLPVATHLNLDFSLGVGYLFGEYEQYTPMDGHYVWQATCYRRYFGPTRAEISLVWQIGNDHPERRVGFNRKRGGRR